jgi:hypothetical protein
VKNLLECLYCLKKQNVTSKEFNLLEARSDITGKFWTVAYLKNRLIEAGYDVKMII